MALVEFALALGDKLDPNGAAERHALVTFQAYDAFADALMQHNLYNEARNLPPELIDATSKENPDAAHVLKEHLGLIDDFHGITKCSLSLYHTSAAQRILHFVSFAGRDPQEIIEVVSRPASIEITKESHIRQDREEEFWSGPYDMSLYLVKHYRPPHIRAPVINNAAMYYLDLAKRVMGEKVVSRSFALTMRENVTVGNPTI